MKWGLYTLMHLLPLILRRASEALPTLRRTRIHYFLPTGLGSPIALVQPRMGPSSHQPFLPGHCDSVKKGATLE